MKWKYFDEFLSESYPRPTLLSDRMNILDNRLVRISWFRNKRNWGICITKFAGIAFQILGFEIWFKVKIND